ncbi:MAG: hypothetical protein RRY54_02235 [Angelakisella sp.]
MNESKMEDLESTADGMASEQEEQTVETVQDGTESSYEEIKSHVQKQAEEIAALREEIAQMRTLPHVVGRTPGGEGIDRQRFDTMSYGERLRLKNENPKLYSDLTE